MDTIRFQPAPTPICQLAERKLHESPYFFLKRISCQFSAGVLTLRGRVPHSRLREFAESIAARVEGVQAIDNQVEVCDPYAWPHETRRRASA